MKPGDSTTTSALRPEIAASWRRSTTSGLRPERSMRDHDIGPVDPGSRLSTAAAPVLDQLLSRLTGSGLCVLLADSSCRLVERRFTDPRTDLGMDEVNAVPGALLTEDNAGTNGLGTPYELRRGVAVHGTEHFAEKLRKFSCYGHPIRHPITRRVDGVLDITAVASEANPLFAPLLQRAVEDIELRLWEGTREPDKRLLSAFHVATRRRCDAVLAFAGEVVLASKSALDQLDTEDHALLRALLAEMPRSGKLSETVRLSSGAEVEVHAEAVSGSGGGVLAKLRTSTRRRARVPASRGQPSDLERKLAALAATTEPVLIAGEPGSGRSSAARAVASASAVQVLDAADVLVGGERAWIAEFRELSAKADVLVLEGIELLPDATCAHVLRALSCDRPPRFVLTCTTPLDLSPRAASLAAMCTSRVDLVPLRHRTAEFPKIVRTMLAAIRPGAALRLTPGALDSLIAHRWPGNLRELHGVLRGSAARRTAGDLTLDDLPAAYRVSTRHELAGRERAECDAIVEALHAAAGNKVRAAKQLGISRTTLYSRMRALGLSR